MRFLKHNTFGAYTGESLLNPYDKSDWRQSPFKLCSIQSKVRGTSPVRTMNSGLTDPGKPSSWMETAGNG